MVFTRWRQCAPHLLHASLGLPESTLHAALWSVQPFFAELKAVSRYTLQQATPFSPWKLPLPTGDLNPHPIHGSLGSPEPQHKRHLDWFNCFCTAHGRASLYFTMGRPLPSKLPLSTGVSGHHVIHSSVDSKESSTQTASQSVELFLQGSLLWQTDRPCYSVSNNRPHICT